jgi:ArsR family transcriptional regulator, arsenate/arsenite/antimonite-responsive transcriptional repressor
MMTTLPDAVNFFKALGEPIRLRLACLLAAENGQELCNCECVDALEETQPNVSRHLKILTQAGLVHERRDGRWIYYRITTDATAMASLLPIIADLNDPLVHVDLRRLRERLAVRQEGKCVLGVQKRHLLSGSSSQGAVEGAGQRTNTRGKERP